MRSSHLIRPIVAVVAPAIAVAASTSCARHPTQLEAAITFADSALAHAIAAERVPGAVLLVARNGRVLHERAYGSAHLYDYGGTRLYEPEAMTTDHVFDLASLTKVMATTFGLMLLVDRGQLDLDAPVHTYLPEFRGPEKDRVRVRDLLTHGAGLYRWLPIYYHASTPAGAYEYIHGLPLAFPVGEERQYSDLGFMLLGYIVERVTGSPLDTFLERDLYAPLGLPATSFNPGREGVRFAATSHGNPFERRMVADDDFGYQVDEDPDSFRRWREHTLIGEVNDGNAFYAHGGVAGHAGLFSGASDLHTLLEVLVNGGVHEGERVVGEDVVREFLRPQAFGNGLGWAMSADVVGMDDPPAGTFAHSGFTGTYVLGLPRHGLAVVLLMNRQNVGVDAAGYYPDVNEVRRPIIERIVRAAEAEGDSAG